ncbi:hypothetical protein ALI144C_20020 [Actinosynnema sp. ALI-1.44]|uniref:CU044_5270 family protein n=1 Tax=Actinosynnema sp. ALI-1.44 TaxID=1933779 RepID=UPI00097C6C01|nr:CU044_5270 family protein [Actinosynnema sp. ALI-1.44]ONI81590.1 hypothetical protein ALI144C_20020 [Actinosynnema sp. ALI-1.44]
MTDEDFLPPVLTRALADLHAVEPDEQVLRKTRENLMQAVAKAETTEAPRPKRRRHWGRWVAASAVVAAIVPGALVAPTLTDSPRYASAAEVLIKAADEIKNVDPVLKPGQYLYSRSHGWHLAYVGGKNKVYEFVNESTPELWIPADPRQEWMGRYPKGQRKWIVGSEQEVKAEGIDLDLPKRNAAEVVRAPCGDWGAAEAGRKPCDGRNGWFGGTPPEAYDKIPTGQQELYDQLRRETADRGQHPDVQMLVQTGYVIGSPAAPARIRAAYYRALALMPSLRITDQSSNLDGQVGVAIGVDGGVAKMEIVVDPKTGRFIGTREWTNGRLHSTWSSRTAVVDGMGTRPS